ncbi:MAG: hypothetical protein H6738_21255 [Alphaproteobacteria bacterium]|nr:hypothetical protein [Alphaproteobacteria bacterium]MCB9699323.1 hypothetical protein [Alphaproteobacteria bacterium]
MRRTTTWRPMVAVALVAGLGGCKAPPEAPTELSELAGFLFEHFDDEDPRDVELGVRNLIGWLEPNIESTEEGYTVDNLSESVIDSVSPDREHDLSSLGGASVAYVSANGVAPIARTLLLEEQEEVFSSNYKEHDRTYLTDETCFMPHECDFVDTDNHVVSKMPLGIEVVTHSDAQYRWIELTEGEYEGKYALLHRAWLVDEAQPNVDWMKIHDQLYLGVTMPWDDTACRLGTTWVAAEILSFDPAIALSMMVDSMRSEGETIDEFIAEK